MGWLCGKLSDGYIPLIFGFDALPSVTADNLKAFSAAFGTTGTAPLFHMANVTPEARGNNVVESFILSCQNRRVIATKEDLRYAYKTLNGDKDDRDEVHLVALGNPHLSISELKQLSELVSSDDRPKNSNVEVIACIGRHVYSDGKNLNYIQKLESFGVKFINDTCWCMLLDPPIIPSNNKAQIVTNSAKYATYGPGLTNRQLRFTSTHGCIEASKTGRIARHCTIPQYLRSFSVLAIRHFPK